jgi:hypothetical protein
MPILLDYTKKDASGNNVAVTDEAHIIEDVGINRTYDASGNLTLEGYEVDITLDSALLDSSGNQWTNIALKLPTTIDTTFNILTCELAVCHYDGYQPSKPGSLEYMTWTTEEFSNGSPSLSKIFELEPECVNVLVMFNNNKAPISNYRDNLTYRLRVDNDDVYDYDIECNREAGTGILNVTLVDSNEGLHYDALNRVLTNAGLQLNSVMPAYDTGKGANFLTELMTNRDQNKILVLGTPTNITPNFKLFQVVIENKKDVGKTDIDNIILYKQVVRQLKL